MKPLLILLLALAYACCGAGQRVTTDPSLLAQQITSPYKTERDKVEAIYKWVANNISYNTPAARKNIIPDKDYYEEFTDTGFVLRSLNDRVAWRVLQKKSAVCDGYTRLFKCLCDYAGITCEIINGYGRTYRQRPGKNFRSNHSWNAVMIDSSWHLLDVTWGSGYITEGNNNFVHWYDDFYFLTPPRDFIVDHYPEDMRWTLLPDPPVSEEFYNTPFKYAAYGKLNVKKFGPLKGIMNVHEGDSIVFEIKLAQTPKQFVVSPLPFADSLNTQSFNIVADSDGNKFTYTYHFDPSSKDVNNNPLFNSSWLYIILNEQVIMRYKVNVK
ncbi:MAG: hypothetical protein JWN76_130 [Chitinophagaceae bacterium]|nr:hypothetical protein [Chitinophagaceae bacterium]